MRMTQALEIVVTAPIVSFRNPLYAGVQVGLPCPPPSTVGGFLAAAVGGWDQVPETTRFAMTFRAEGTGVDLETYHPLGSPGTPTNITIKDREFLAHTTLTVWLIENLDMWQRALRRPVWPLRLGRSQDLVAVKTGRTDLVSRSGVQGHAVMPQEIPGTAGTPMRLTTAISDDRARKRWGSYCYAAQGAAVQVDTGLATQTGQAIALLPSTHPAQFATA
ncbi:CRISPR-associated protein Cas5 [Nocardia amamiensis]|uniref:CRISPR-associated protein Cas5 n=1 Tax=Nocardia amamiensis TaxID=404578 RepID=UPI00082EE9AC|nr:CRISPR-associated protein Cas5 [Nocardia amamiensis]